MSADKAPLPRHSRLVELLQALFLSAVKQSAFPAGSSVNSRRLLLLKAVVVSGRVTSASGFTHTSRLPLRLPSIVEFAAELCSFTDPAACCSSQQAGNAGQDDTAGAGCDGKSMQQEITGSSVLWA